MAISCECCGAPITEKVCPYCGTTNQNEELREPVIQVDVTYTATEPNPADQYSKKSWMTTFLLCFFLGLFGIHRFYVQKIGTGILWLFSYGAFFVGWLHDLILLATQNFKDAEGKLIVINPNAIREESITVKRLALWIPILLLIIYLVVLIANS